MNTAALEGDRIALHRLTVQFASEAYLAWLNDTEVLRYRNAPSTMTRKEMVDWLKAEPANSRRFAILAEGRHIGNISLDGISEGTADLGIMLGAKDVWGKGYGREAIKRLTRYGFEDLELTQITASSPNPSFNAIMRKLGWRHLGTSEKSFPCDGKNLDIERWSTNPPSLSQLGKA